MPRSDFAIWVAVRPWAAARSRQASPLPSQFRDRAAQQLDRLPDALDRRQSHVLVFDRQHVVVTDRGKRLAATAPPLFVVAMAQRYVIPGPLRYVFCGPNLNAAIARQILSFEPGVLGVHMVDRRAQPRDRGERIGTH